MKQFALAITLILIALGVPVIKAQPTDDVQLEQRMQALTQQLRCLVCRNETLADSPADVAEDLKAGKSDQEIVAFLHERYGDFVLYKPPVKSTTYLLWFGPFVLLIGGTFLLYRYVGQRRRMIADKPLTEEERKRAEELLKRQIG